MVFSFDDLCATVLPALMLSLLELMGFHDFLPSTPP